MSKQLSGSDAQDRPKGAVITVILVVFILLVSGCATVAQGERNVDPWENVNRPIYNFNREVDRLVLEPVADAYVRVTPQPIRNRVSNFFDNIAYINVILNSFLQGKFEQGISDTTRFVFNSTFGILGLFDVATAMGLEPNEEDFGITLGVWGTGAGPYMMLPLLGPSTVRDVPAWPVSAVTSPLFYVGNAAISVPLGLLSAIDLRARAAGVFQFIDVVALDPYVFTREAYLQRRLYLIYDGAPPLPEFFDDFDDFDDFEDMNEWEGEAAPPADG